MSNYDVIIIGSGLGGLVCGAKLAKNGYKVALFEKHSIVGGCATTFKRKGYILEVGLHELDGLDSEDYKCKIFEDLGVFDNVTFLKTPDFYRFVNSSIDIVIPNNMDEAMSVLINKFPQEKRGIIKFFNIIKRTRKEVYKFFDIPRKSMKTILSLPYMAIKYFSTILMFLNKRSLKYYLNKWFTNENLKLILSANIAYYHDDPNSLAMVTFATGNGSYFQGGSHYIQGGSHNLPFYLADFIKKNCGEVYTNTEVIEIIHNNKVANGVIYKDKKKNSYTVTVKYIVSNSSIPITINKLITNCPKIERYKKKISKHKHSLSVLSIFLGFNEKYKKKIKNKYYSTFYMPYLKSLDGLHNTYYGDHNKRNFVFVDYGVIDSQLCDSNKSVGVISILDTLSDWEYLNKEDYKLKKDEIARIYLKRIEHYFPGFEECIDYINVATPLTIKRYTGNPNGSIYGFAQTPDQSGWFRPDSFTPLKNLFFSSVWNYPGGGFTGSTISGYRCANEIIRISK